MGTLKIERTETPGVWRYVREVAHYENSQRIVTGVEIVLVQLEIDDKALAEFMAQRACASKSGKSVMQDGIITSRVIHRQTKEGGAL